MVANVLDAWYDIVIRLQNRYNTVHYNTVMNTVPNMREENEGQTMNSQKTSYNLI